jgi:hypothetical protein
MVIPATDRWTHIVHKSGEDSTQAGRLTMRGKDNNLIFISRYIVRVREISMYAHVVAFYFTAHDIKPRKVPR